jgi:hypothetical protein
MAPNNKQAPTTAADFGGIAEAQAGGMRAPFFQEGHYLIRVDSFRDKLDEETNIRIYILNATVLARFSEKGNEPGTPVGNVISRGNFQGARAAQMGQVKALMVAMTGLKTDLNDPVKAAQTAATIIEQGLGDGKVIEVKAVNNKKGTYVTPYPQREEPVPAAEWVGLAKPATLNALYGAGNADIAQKKIAEILELEAK